MTGASPIDSIADSERITRIRIIIRGIVQGVGFRPFIYRLAKELDLNGWVSNSPDGVIIEAEGGGESLKKFLLRIPQDKPSLASIHSMEHTILDPENYSDFRIELSQSSGKKTALILPDIAVCPDCLKEIFDPANRRCLYPFTNCTNCGPRYSIIQALPYDRNNTTMKRFEMCERCQSEYNNPSDRRFHAQPNACPLCGPQLVLKDKNHTIAARHDALLQTVEALRKGKIAAVKGLGGFHLMVDAGNDDAVNRLRLHKAREEKPFALMFPSLEMIEKVCLVSEMEKRLLFSPECPIVLLKRKRYINGDVKISPSVAPGNPYLGIMLPYTPLHHILMRELNFPVIATSGNLKDEPICIDDETAMMKLSNIADLFLTHNRPIARPVDDSVARIIADRQMIIRRARGYAPLPIQMRTNGRTIIAVGGHLKNTVALAKDDSVFISQHLGDLETEEAYASFKETIDTFINLYESEPDLIVCDMHPDYLSTKFAESSGIPVVKVQHHHAHLYSCIAENEIDPPLTGVVWDGTGYGLDATIWGGEFFIHDGDDLMRKAHFRTFPLPGGDTAIKEPRRTAIGLLYEIFGESIFDSEEYHPLNTFSPIEREILRTMLKGSINSPKTSSAGRLFDAVASIIGLRHFNNFEGQAAMELEFLTENYDSEQCYEFLIIQSGDALIIDWQPAVLRILDDLRNNIPPEEISVKFHNTMAAVTFDMAQRIGLEKIVLSGGCFQNKYLIERTIGLLQEGGFRVYWHQRTPTNDGGISLGQAAAVKS
ncbi:carbamoyltransferase HypF [bacterium]|nr:carbamoyltransferase HypF [FCB group bacterium]MBL7191275.1 carbamoyltransferase HypF [bacterium]